ncbi:zinc knuckle containing protein [Pseudozyma hubeiensis SY62]|uniref:Zinc knuckle containing protein n=1 Tax=Pseudozyma hubeiensis (strain SY62) TaxID=1305764 RepID=R9PBH3_PSEHS|nr:zinc knuckle containing protein [Pseudozyma hubeiensis SY62]GAC95410.1 zinc knuckle containing protein [Pseudozyma hubeiensis SY62]
MNGAQVVDAAQQAALSTVEKAGESSKSSNGSAGGKGKGSASRSGKASEQNRASSSKSTKNRYRTGTSDDGIYIDLTGEGSDREAKSDRIDDGTNGDGDHDAEDEQEEEGAYTQEAETGEMSFVIDTAGDMDVDREIALEDEAKADRAETHVEAGLLLPSHISVIPQTSGNAAATQPNGRTTTPSRDVAADDLIDADNDDLEGDMGDFEQLDMDPSTANRYYGAEEKAERRAKEQCLACGELGHDRRHCPHQHCLACGAMDDHPTRFCPMSTSCFRCGGMGHQTRTCPKPRRGPRSEECERCGSYSHVKALCPTLWRVYTYSTLDDVDRHRAKVFFKLQSTSSTRDPRRNLDPDPEELSDSEDEFAKAGEPQLPTPSGSGSQFDPATRWCYNCSTSSNHWGDDCPEPRCNPTRGTNEPSAFSEFVSRLGPFAKLLPGAPPLAGFEMPSSQFTFSVGNSATMHVSSDAIPSSSGRSTPNNKRLAIGKHVLTSPSSSRTASPRPGDNVVSFGRTKAVAVEGGFLTRKEAKKNKKPLPEHLFKQWLRERQDHPEYADEIRAVLEEKADLEAKGLDTRGVKSIKEIVGGGKRGDGPNKRRKGDTFSDPVVVDSDDDFRDDFDSDSSDDEGGSGRKKRRGDGKGSRGQKKNTGWGHNGDNRGSTSSSSGFKGGRFSNKRQDDRVDLNNSCAHSRARKTIANMRKSHEKRCHRLEMNDGDEDKFDAGAYRKTVC